ncbi:MAG: LysM peptidoglycan-binding domain-containing protein [Bauldia sp.]
MSPLRPSAQPLPPAIVPPTFDVVRVEPSGDTVVAGQADPGSKVELLDGASSIATAEADDSGAWAMALDKPLAPGSHDLAIRTTSKDKAVATLSDQRVTVSVPEKGSKDVLVVLDFAQRAQQGPRSPGRRHARRAGQRRRLGNAGQRTRRRGNAIRNNPGSQRPRRSIRQRGCLRRSGGERPGRRRACRVRQRGRLGRSDAASGRARNFAGKPPGRHPPSLRRRPQPVLLRRPPRLPPRPQPTPRPPVAPSSGTQVATAEPPIKTEPPIAAEPAIPKEPAIAAEPAIPAEPPVAVAPKPEVTVATIEADTAGNIYIAGTSATPDPVRVYLDDKPVGDATPSAAGTWLVQTTRDLPAGKYTVRADQIGSGGAVVARSEVPFDREVEVADLKPAATAGAGEAGATVSGTVPMETVVIKHGDNLWRIARGTWGKGIRWSTIYQANTDQIRNPHWIYPGQVFIMPKGSTTWTD